MDGSTSHILIFGESGVGKSSIINMLFDENKTKTSDDATGTTFECKEYNLEYGAKNYHVYDTTGLSCPEAGKVSHKDAMRKLVDLLKSISEGINILVFCIKKGAILKPTLDNYNLFVSGICQSKVPVILAVTYCELDDPMSQWWDRNKDEIKEKHYLDKITTCVCMTTIRDGKYSQIFRNKYLESREELMKKIVEISLVKPWKMDNFIMWIRAIVKVSWNAASDYIGIRKNLPISNKLYQLYLKAGFSKEDAIKESNYVYQEMNTENFIGLLCKRLIKLGHNENDAIKISSDMGNKIENKGNVPVNLKELNDLFIKLGYSKEDAAKESNNLYKKSTLKNET